ncbi:MAG: Gfo/Idh/MocA family oxidoreductase [Bacteroidales bacterium]|nr:Gfo/Idh/MocA family oxidoreductase [Bacteroidales bacterium]MCM1414542.1 Gfo/Idh/MocA family oxidoreductase [bacterium]MCM1422592.1 Gfo/Idh/MocA family oxidoreductase [bacterium]
MDRNYKIAFCGLGSIGKRHLRNTVRYLQEHGCTFRIDAVRSGEGAPLDKHLAQYISAQYTYEEEIPRDYDIIFITNPTAEHGACIQKYQHCTKSMFIEKPVVSDAGWDFSTLSQDLICYVACPLRYTKTLQYVKEHVDCGAAYAVRAVCSTYLPNWRPGVDYRNTYSAHKAMGGGVAIDLIHEWDYLAWLFGRPDHVESIRKKVSALEIDSEDIAVYMGYSENRVYELHLDYFGREEKRCLEIFLPAEAVTADLRSGRIRFGGSGEDIVLSEERDAYQQREIAHFFDIINGVCENDNTVMEAMKTLMLAEGRA